LGIGDWGLGIGIGDFEVFYVKISGNGINVFQPEHIAHIINF
jgi:hypothetical protein